MDLMKINDKDCFINLVEQDRIPDFIEALKKSKPSEELKEKLNQIVDIGLLEEDNSQTLELVELLISFGYDKINLVEFEGEIFKLLTKNNFYLNKYNYKEYPGMISLLEIYNKHSKKFFYFNEYCNQVELLEYSTDNPGAWLSLFDSDTYSELIELFSIWKRYPPCKFILDDFKTVLNYNGDIFIDAVEKYIIYDTSEYFENKYYYSENEYSDCMDYLNNKKKLFEYFLDFGYEITDKDMEKIKDIEDRKSNILNQFIKIRAGKKIARFIEKAMDDEFELSELRKRIELRRFKDLMKEKENE